MFGQGFSCIKAAPGCVLTYNVYVRLSRWRKSAHIQGKLPQSVSESSAILVVVIKSVGSSPLVGGCPDT